MNKFIPGTAFKLISYHPTYVDQVVHQIKNVYCQLEKVCKFVGLDKSAAAQNEFADSCLEMADMGLSILCVDTKKDRVAAFSFTDYCSASVKESHEQLLKGARTDEFRRFCEMNIREADLFDIMKHYKVKTMLEQCQGGVAPEYMNKGIASAVTKASLSIAETLNKGENLDLINPKYQLDKPEGWFNLTSSKYTEKASNRLGLERVHSCTFEEFVGIKKTDNKPPEMVTWMGKKF